MKVYRLGYREPNPGWKSKDDIPSFISASRAWEELQLPKYSSREIWLSASGRKFKKITKDQLYADVIRERNKSSDN